MSTPPQAGAPPTKQHTPAEKEIIVRHAGERRRVTCTQSNEQVKAGMLPQDQHMREEEIALAVKHSQEWAALDVDQNNEFFVLQRKYTKLRGDLDARQKGEIASLPPAE